MQTLKKRSLLLVFMLLLNTNNHYSGQSSDLQTKLLLKINNKLVSTAETLVETDKKI